MSSSSVPQTDPKAAYLAQAGDIQAAIAHVLNGGRYVLGDAVEAFEQEFAAFVGRRQCIGVASGTDALVAALQALHPTPDDYIVTVSHTSVATVAAIELAGAKPLLVDIDDVTFTLDPGELERVLAHPPGRIAAIVVVHLYGQPADLDAILPLARAHNVTVVEDCAQSHGARLHDRPVGSFGDLAAFSFYPTKNLGCIGDGGAVAADDPHLAAHLRSYRQYGWDAARVSAFPGVCSRLDELQAAILRVKLKHLDQDNASRRRIAARYTYAFAGLPLACPITREGALPVFHQYVLRLAERDAFRRLLEDQGIHTGIHYAVPVHLQPAYKDRVAIGPSGLARTERAAGEIVSLPMYPQLSDRQVDQVCAAVADVCSRL